MSSAKLKIIFINIFLIIVSIFILIPIIWGWITSIKIKPQIVTFPPIFIPKPATIANYITAFKSQPLLKQLLNTVLLAGSASIISTLLSFFAAYAFSRFKVKTSNLIMGIVIFGLAIPGITNLIPLYNVYNKLGIIGTRFGVILLYLSGLISFSAWVLKGFIDAIPTTLDEASHIDGASLFQCLLKITFPLVLPGLFSVFIINFIAVWNDFFIVAVFLATTPQKQTITYSIYKFSALQGINYGAQNAVAIVAIIFPIMLLLIFRKKFISVMIEGAIKG